MSPSRSRGRRWCCFCHAALNFEPAGVVLHSIPWNQPWNQPKQPTQPSNGPIPSSAAANFVGNGCVSICLGDSAPAPRRHCRDSRGKFHSVISLKAPLRRKNNDCRSFFSELLYRTTGLGSRLHESVCFFAFFLPARWREAILSSPIHTT